eukprot:5538426-Karenia_brevis.AAC.1
MQRVSMTTWFKNSVLELKESSSRNMCVIRDSLESLGRNSRWVPHDRNPADCLTIIKGNVECLLKMMRSGKYQFADEQDQMDARQEYRERTGKSNPRPTQSTTPEN